MIDKRIFYCWFGDSEIPDFAQACMDSWEKLCPDYEIVKVCEDNFDIHMNPFTEEAYKHRNFTFVADYARLWILKQKSGFYLDTDIRLIRSLDDLREYDAIIPMSGKGFYTNGCLGCSYFPSIYQEALNKLKNGRCANELMNELTYKKYDVYGERFALHDNIAFLGNDYFVTPGYTSNEHTIGIHYACGAWQSLWQGSYDKRKTFKEFKIYQDDVRDRSAEKKLFDHEIEHSNLIMQTFGTPVRKDHIFYGNYFYNPKVIVVKGTGFKIARLENVEADRWMKVEDVMLGIEE